MHDRAIEQIGDRRQPDMRMQTHVQSLAGHEGCMTDVVEKMKDPIVRAASAGSMRLIMRPPTSCSFGLSVIRMVEVMAFTER